MPGRGVAQILRANVLTRFNAILGSLLVVVMVAGPPQDALFGIVLVVNTGIGIFQEVRAKRALMAACIVPLLALPLGRRIFGLQLPPADVALAVAGVVVIAIAALTLWRRFGPAAS